MIGKLANAAGFQAGWFACVGSAAIGEPWLGLIAAGLLLLLHLRFTEDRVSEAALVALSGTYGYVADSLLVVSGVLGFHEGARLGGPSTLWMVALWMLYAATLRSSFAWIRGRYILGAVVGAISGPLSYAAGARLGAVELAGSLPAGLAAIGFLWAVSLPVLLWLEVRTRRPVPAKEVE